MGERASVMFSGGVDSTLVACLLLEKFDAVHLITFDYGADLFLKNARKSAQRVINVFGEDRVRFDLINIRKWWLASQVRNAKQFNLVCMSCKLIMHTRAICYCLENDITAHSDGSIREQGQHPEQMEGTLKVLSDYYREYDIDFTSPAYDFSTEAEDEKLADLGIDFGTRVRVPGAKGSHIHKQPFCLFAFFDVLFSDNPFYPHQQEDVFKHLEKNLQWAKTLIVEFFKEKGLDLDEVLKQRRQRLGLETR
ncbi:MAG: 7-cyano-7-deazaguanine synthase [Candidatus Coatesbacteria bacterium]|nr:7-cyano-7-deazaguanine synthase [Candidatus Coatesbacteria bacterium]